MLCQQHETSVPHAAILARDFTALSELCLSTAPNGSHPIRWACTSNLESDCGVEVGVLTGVEEAPPSIFDFASQTPRSNGFNIALVIPTGIGATVGGHAGDAGPVARLLAGIADTLVTHPNVVSASDINELPENGLYVEGSVLTRMLMGTVGLRRTQRSNRLLVIVHDHDEPIFVNAAINAVNAARSAYGLTCSKIVRLGNMPKLRSRYAGSGTAVGRIEGLEHLSAVIDANKDSCDAVAIASVIDVPREFHTDYFRSEGDMVNPWGGVEAMLTHSLSMIHGMPCTHAPMLESRDVANWDPGVVDPRMAAEAVSWTYFNCVLKGLMRSPSIMPIPEESPDTSLFCASDVSCLVIPDRCVGLPVLAALEQDITIIAVRENENMMKNDLRRFDAPPGKLLFADNYLEAAGILCAMRAGIDPASVRRPLSHIRVERIKAMSDVARGRNQESATKQSRTI